MEGRNCRRAWLKKEEKREELIKGEKEGNRERGRRINRKWKKKTDGKA